MPREAALRRLTTAWAVALVTLGTGLSAAPPGPQPASKDARRLWRTASDQILAGDFPKGMATLEKVRKLEPGHLHVANVIEWMREALALTESRERLRARCYEHWVEEAREAVKKAEGAVATEAGDDRQDGADEGEDGADEGEDGDQDGADTNPYKWGVALNYARFAMEYAQDEDVFRAQPWVVKIVDQVLQEIDLAKGRDEWRDALALYDYLKDLYPDNADYEAGFDFCRKRAHLDFVYGPKSTWRTNLRAVTPDAVEDILNQIDDKYVSEVDLKELCLGGLEQLLVLSQADSLTEIFPTLGDEDLVAEFVARLNGRIKRIQRTRGRFTVRDALRTFDEVLGINASNLRLPEAVIVDEFVAGLLEPLDEFTAVIWPAEVSEFNKHTRGEFVGVGIQITKPEEGKPIRVESPLEDSPAYRAGVKPGDLITEVDGESTREISTMQAVRIITGEPGTTVVLTIMDPVTEESRRIPLTRETIIIRTVGGFRRDMGKTSGWDYFIDTDNKIGYVRINGFMDNTVEDLRASLKQLLAEDCRGLILDLRFNPGGLLTSAREMCELFLEEGEPIVKTKGRNREDNATIHARSRKALCDLPLIVLVNGYSASASEIVAGDLAGLKEACVVGDRTFGKGSVQRLIPIADNQAYLKLTTAFYHVFDKDLPGDASWYCLDKQAGGDGIEPHVAVKVFPQELNKILRLRRGRDLLRGREQTEIPREILERRRATTQPSRHIQEDEDPDIDPQMLVALDLMRVKLLSNQPWALAPRHDRTLTRANGHAVAEANEKAETAGGR